MKIPAKEYNALLKLIKNWSGTKKELQALYDSIYSTYDDGREVIRWLDSYQRKWIMELH